MSYIICRNCGYRIPLSDIIRSENPTLVCPSCGSKDFALYIGPNDLQAITYLISLVFASYIAPLFYLPNERGREA